MLAAPLAAVIALLPVAPPAAPASVAGAVYADDNNNGTRDAGEPGIPDVPLTLSGIGADGAPVDVITASGPDGSFAFPGLGPGTYAVVETQPSTTSTAGTGRARRAASPSRSTRSPTSRCPRARPPPATPSANSSPRPCPAASPTTAAG
ncbi:SdrD B-like domain-containing protein [Actinokineospora sp. UTMC 2448]|uniref:SdrD B-like domain-containing protein n=1 Tax=Actinokineospora sp. UTMC 2448 TaxID=2268449 RepID=UPI00216401BD|nr:SdrD B-like domain-containing protein [Actinokineospora sp. UTMC 2448]UVS78419.1 hypothetical protein Actkin_02152 [Actinokineospora sp. UTMC 2448]